MIRRKLHRLYEYTLDLLPLAVLVLLMTVHLTWTYVFTMSLVLLLISAVIFVLKRDVRIVRQNVLLLVIIILLNPVLLQIVPILHYLIPVLLISYLLYVYKVTRTIVVRIFSLILISYIVLRTILVPIVLVNSSEFFTLNFLESGVYVTKWKGVSCPFGKCFDTLRYEFFIYKKPHKIDVCSEKALVGCFNVTMIPVAKTYFDVKHKHEEEEIEFEDQNYMYFIWTDPYMFSLYYVPIDIKERVFKYSPLFQFLREVNDETTAMIHNTTFVVRGKCIKGVQQVIISKVFYDVCRLY